MATKPPFEDFQVNQAFMEGRIGADGVGVPQTYPRMMYKAGTTTDHLLADKPLKIAGCDVQTTLVNDAEEEQIALLDGWFFNPSLELTEDQKRDAELASLRSQVAKQKPADPAKEAA